ncbi:MAG: restriction endonuclease subunit S [Clostridia bacterium]|nr:restriction endonuclease subunit S [Clostridia bacterium]
MLMAKTKLGKYIALSDLKNSDNKLDENFVVGLSTNKEIIKTKADLDGVNMISYKLFPPKHFAYVADTSRRGEKISLAYNTIDTTYLVSSISTVFYVKDTEELLPDYLFMYFNRPEFDRYSRFNSWGSAREAFTWEDLCDMEIDLPSIPEQQKVVDVYNAMLANQKAYETGLEDLKLTCDAYIENLRREIPSESIGQYIEQRNEKNISSQVKLAQGININKQFITPQRLGESLNGARVVRKGQFAYCDVMHKPDSKMPIALRKDENCVVSGTYKTFEITNSKKLLPEYLMMWFERPEFERYAAYNSFGSARPTFDLSEMQLFAIPIPKIEIQQAIVNIYNAYIMRKEINEKLKAQIKNICPILIRGSLKK